MTQPDTLHTKTPYRIPGLDGTWRITTLRTTNMAADGKATLELVRVQDDDPVVSAPLISADPSKIPQPEPANLHDRLRAELDRRLAVARAAMPGPWEWVQMPTFSALRSTVEVEIGGEDVRPFVLPVANPDPEDRTFIALHDPADAVRRYEGELEVLERHCPVPPEATSIQFRSTCGGCHPRLFIECPEIRSLAHRLGVSVDG